MVRNVEKQGQDMEEDHPGAPQAVHITAASM